MRSGNEVFLEEDMSEWVRDRGGEGEVSLWTLVVKSRIEGLKSWRVFRGSWLFLVLQKREIERERELRGGRVGERESDFIQKD